MTPDVPARPWSVRLARRPDAWTYTIVTPDDRRLRSPLGFRDAADALTAGEHDAATYYCSRRTTS